MVVLSQQILDTFSGVKSCKHPTRIFSEIPVIDLTNPDAKTEIVEACKEFGIFKVINHGVPLDYIAKLEAEAVRFFKLPQSEKEKATPANPFGYGSKRIGPNGDIGWVEYLLCSMNPVFALEKSMTIFSENSEIFWSLVNEYVSAVKNMACGVLEMIADGLKIEPRNVLSRLLNDEKSDSIFRLNHYPPCPSEFEALSGLNLIGFGEHTDPQIISVLRSNSTSGLQISIKDGTWVTVPPDPFSFFINVGDSLQVITNGRFRSVKHRVLAGTLKSRVSMVYFGGPPLSEKIAPLLSLMEDGEQTLYNEFTWCDYKRAAYKTRLGDNRLAFFQKTSSNI